MQGNERIPRGIPGRLQRTLIFMVLPFVCASCGIMPEEEELPAAPVIRSYEAAEYEQALVMRGDMILTKKVKCTYASAKQEKYSFPPALQSDADVNENQYEPFGHSAVKAARRKKTYREKQKEQHRDSGSSRIDAIVLYTFFNNDGYREKGRRQY